MYIDVYCFLPFKMEELYTIAVSFGKIVHNRGFSLSLLERKKDNRTNRQREVVFFLSSAFTATSFALPGCIRAVFSTSLSRAVPSQRARVEGTGRG